MFNSVLQSEFPMDVVLRKYGNSTVLVLPPGVLRDLDLRVGNSLSMNTTPNGQITLTKKQRYSLSDLIAQCDPKAPVPADIAVWDGMPSVGRERI